MVSSTQVCNSTGAKTVIEFTQDFGSLSPARVWPNNLYYYATKVAPGSRKLYKELEGRLKHAAHTFHLPTYLPTYLLCPDLTLVTESYLVCSQCLTASSCSGGFFLGFMGELTPFLSYDASPSTIAHALRGLSTMIEGTSMFGRIDVNITGEQRSKDRFLYQLVLITYCSP